MAWHAASQHPGRKFSGGVPPAPIASLKSRSATAPIVDHPTSTTESSAAEWMRCPICAASLRPKHLERHNHRVHGRQLGKGCKPSPQRILPRWIVPVRGGGGSAHRCPHCQDFSAKTPQELTLHRCKSHQNSVVGGVQAAPNLQLAQKNASASGLTTHSPKPSRSPRESTEHWQRIVEDALDADSRRPSTGNGPSVLPRREADGIWVSPPLRPDHDS